MPNIEVTPTSEKRLVRGAAVTQLMPAKYPWAWQWYLDGNSNHWTPGEIAMGKDIGQYEHELSPSERHIFTTVLAYLTTSDILAMRNVSLAVMEKITAPEVQMALMRHGFEETIHCYIDGTEILTDEGFIDFKDVTTSHRVAQYHNDSSISFVTPDEVLHDYYDGEMHTLSNASGTYLSIVTPEHRCVVIDPRNNNNLEIKLAKNLSPANFNFPVNGYLVNKEAYFYSLLDSLRIAFQADGSFVNPHVRDVGKLSGKRDLLFTLSKRRKIERLRSILHGLDLEYRMSDYNEDPSNLTQVRIRVKIPLDVQIDKEFNWIDLRKIDAGWIQCFFDELVHWDGHKRYGDALCYTNTNVSALERVETIACLAGYRVGRYAVKDRENCKPAWQLHCYKQRHASGKTITNVQTYYKGYVHCVGVPTGMIVTRLNGRITVSGNTHTYQHCLECLKLDQTDIYTRYLRVPEMNGKFALSNKYLKKALELHSLETKEDVIEFLYGYIFFALIFEGVWFYNGFTPIFNMNRRNLMTNTGEQLQYILRDEVNHVKLGAEIIRGIIREENITLDPVRIRTMFLEADAAEETYIKMVLKDGMIGHSVADHMQQSRVVSNRRLKQIGMDPVFPDTEAPFKWLDEIAGGLRKEKNFFNIGDLVA